MYPYIISRLDLKQKLKQIKKKCLESLVDWLKKKRETLVSTKNRWVMCLLCHLVKFCVGIGNIIGSENGKHKNKTLHVEYFESKMCHFKRIEQQVLVNLDRKKRFWLIITKYIQEFSGHIKMKFIVTFILRPVKLDSICVHHVGDRYIIVWETRVQR